MWTALIAPVAGLVKDYLSNKRDESNAKSQAKQQALSNTALWEQEMAKATNHSWKDEWFTILLSAPVIAIMYGVVMDYKEVILRVGLAFEQLNSLPEWYQYLLFIAVLASFGVRMSDSIASILGKR